jgi:hypothetical protein
MHKRTIILTSSTLAACVAAIALLWLLGGGLSARAALALSAVEGPAGELRVCATCAYQTVQAAVDAAISGDVIKVAQGTYTDIHARAGITQVVYITKSVTIRGGYTTTNWTTPYPITQPTTLDAQRQGRVLYITGYITPTIEGLRITGGDADGLGDYWGYDAGGGVYILNATATLSGNMIFSNTASIGGGVFLWHSPTTVRDNTIRDNTTTPSYGEGGGLYANESKAVVIGNTIRDNTSAVTGGGIHLSYSGATVSRNVIRGNMGSLGGGLFLNESNAGLEDNIIVSNTATWAGGGLHMEGAAPLLVNNVVIDNQCATMGAGINIRGTRARLLHTTIARNVGGDGSGIHVSYDILVPASVVFTNTIIVSHTVGITVTAGNTATLNGTLWHANSTDYSGNVIHTNDHSGDPAFAADGYHLTLGSAAVDRGVSAGVDTDIDGDTRPIGRPDIGADEWGTRVYLPLVLRN